jgi:hypothetical protein
MKLNPPVWSHRGWDFRKQGKNVHWVSTAHQTPFRSKFGAQLGLACPFFYWTLSTNHCFCYACWAINVLKPGAFNPESQYFIPLFNKISWLCGQQPGVDEESNEECNSGGTGHDFTDNSNMCAQVAVLTQGTTAQSNNCSWLVK